MLQKLFVPDGQISIHAAREGGDRTRAADNKRCKQFQSTPPVKAATCPANPPEQIPDISIHAAREGGDLYRQADRIRPNNFNPRRP